MLGCSQILGIEDLDSTADGGVTLPDGPTIDAGTVDASAPDATVVECVDHDQCSGRTPVCDSVGGTCRGCRDNNDCTALGADAPICSADGRCGACASDSDCSQDGLNICDPERLVCRGCEAHSECASEVCDIASGVCVDPNRVVYARPDGSSVADCGTLDTPCRSLTDAVDQVSFNRRYLRILGTFNTRLTLSAKTVDVIGEGATLDLTPVDFDTAAGITVNTGAQVTIDGLRVTNLSVGNGIECSDATLTLRQVTSDSHEGNGVNASNCPLIIQESRITGNSELGVAAYVPNGDSGNLVIERSLIADNYGGGINSSVTPLLIRNNLILRNSNLSEYNGAISLNGTGTDAYITYNTIVGNRVNDAYIGIIQCGSAVLSSNIIWGNEWPPSPDDQTLSLDCTQVRNNVSDSTLNDISNNVLGDPLLVAPAMDDYHVMPNSPAIDRGEAGLANLFDYAGNPRPQGAGPDVGAFEMPPPPSP